METESIVNPLTHEDLCGVGLHAKENGNHKLRRRCWDEAFASASESDSISPEPALGKALPEENVEGVKMCSSTTSDGNEKATSTSIVCEAHPSCFKTFSSVREYEDHYNLRHRHKCATCKKSLPSAHILELHVLEAHDTLFSLMAERKPMLACFLETCSTTFWKSDERKEHCLTDHRFPKSFYLWDLTAMGGNKPGKKSGGGSSKGKGANKQNQSKDKRSSPNSKEKSTSIPDPVSEDVSSTSTNGVPTNDSTSVPAATPQSDSMELDAPVLVEHKNKNRKPESSNKSKSSTKFLPTQITFGRHSASRTFKPNYSFGLSKPVSVPGKVGGGSSSMCAGKTELDLSDIKDVLPTSTDSAVDNELT